jgi:glutamyl-tRNA reductase
MSQREFAMQSQGKDIEHAGAQLTQQAENAGQSMAAEMVQQALQAVTDQIKQLQEAVKQQQPIVVPVGSSGRRIMMRKTQGGYEADVIEG